MERCPSCNNDIHDFQDNFCRRCGADLTPYKVKLECCGEEVLDKPGAFCNFCGTEVTQAF